MPKKTNDGQDLKLVNPGAAGLDIGSTMHMAAVSPHCADVPVRSFDKNRDEHVFALAQALDLYDVYQVTIPGRDRRLEDAVSALSLRRSKRVGLLPKSRHRQKPTGAPAFICGRLCMVCWASTSHRSTVSARPSR